MAEWLEIIFKVGGVVALLAVTVYVSRTSAATLKNKVLPELEEIRITLAAIKLHISGVLELKKRVDEDHDKLVVLGEKHDGLQKGVSTIRKDFKEHVTLYHTKS